MGLQAGLVSQDLYPGLPFINTRYLRKHNFKNYFVLIQIYPGALYFTWPPYL